MLNKDKKHIFAFDFDGTLLRSNEIKYQALYESLYQFKALKNEVNLKDFCKKFIHRSGLTREEKIREGFKNLLQQNEIEDLIDIYSKKVETLSNNLFISEEINFALKKFKSMGEVYILSGGRISEITKICAKSNTLNNIDGIICSSYGKEPFLITLKKLGKVIFFGDSEIDYKSALNAKVKFVRITGYSDLFINEYDGITLTSIHDYSF